MKKPPQPTTTREPVVDPPEDGTRRPIPLVTWVGLGASAAGLLTGTVTGMVSISKTNSLEGCVGDECPKSEQSEIDSAHTFARGSNIAFGVAIAGAALAAVGYFVLRPKPEKPASAASVTFGPGGVAGTF